MKVHEAKIIISKQGSYRLYDYLNEKEMEEMVIEHSKDIFGKNSHFYEEKKKINTRAGYGTIPDGFVIDFDLKKLYIIEVELIEHNLRTHICPQIVNFLHALDNINTLNNLVDFFYEGLPSGINLSKEDLTLIVKNWSVVIIIDKIFKDSKRNKTNNLDITLMREHPLLLTVNFLSKNFNKEIITIPFETYVKNKILTDDHLHFFKSFTKLELEEESRRWNFKWENVTSEERLKGIEPGLKNIFLELGQKICNINSNIKEKHPKSGYTTYQISKLKNFCVIKFPKDSLEIHLKVNHDSFVDSKFVTRDLKRTPSWTFDKVFNIRSLEEISYALSLIEQAYDCICKNIKIKKEVIK